MTANPASVQEILNQWGGEPEDRKFGDWLRAGLIGFNTRKEGRFAFRPLHAFFGHDYSVMEEIIGIFNALTEKQKVSFKRGIAIALAETPVTAESEETISDILTLARRTGASHVLPILAERLVDAWESEPTTTKELDGAIARTCGALVKAAGESSLTQDSIKAIVRLAKSNKLPERYVLPLFQKLCELRPSLQENVRAFEPKLDYALSSFEENEPAYPPDLHAAQMMDFLFQAYSENEILSTISSSPPSYDYSSWQQAVVLGRSSFNVPLVPLGPLGPLAAAVFATVQPPREAPHFPAVHAARAAEVVRTLKDAEAPVDPEHLAQAMARNTPRLLASIMGGNRDGRR